MFWFAVCAVVGSVSLVALAFALFLRVFVWSDNSDFTSPWWWSLLGGLALVSVCALLFAYVLGRPGQVTGTPTIRAAWVQVVAGDEACAPTLGIRIAGPEPAMGRCRPAFSARAVVNAADECPLVTVHTGSQSLRGRMEKRQGYAGKGLQGVTVCAASAPSDASRVTFDAALTIPITESWSANRPRKLVLLGDTGCRPGQDQNLKPGHSCDDKAWPFATVARQAAGEQPKPGLTVHIGDYIYQGDDDWPTWERDFFTPAKPLLEASPWILVRGNHERCSNDTYQYPLGFSLLFSDGPAMPCNSTTEMAKPHAVDLSDQLRLIVADSVAAYTKDPNVITSDCGMLSTTTRLAFADAKVCAAVMDVLSGVQHLVPRAQRIPRSGAEIPGRPQVWLLTHVPVFGFEREMGKDGIPGSSAMMGAAWKGARILGVDLVLSGDRHLYQVVTTPAEPDQVSVGTGGVELDDLPFETKLSADEATFALMWPSATPTTFPFQVQQIISSASAPSALPLQKGCSYKGYGFLAAEWKGSSYDRSFRPVLPKTGPRSCP